MSRCRASVENEAFGHHGCGTVVISYHDRPVTLRGNERVLA